MMANLLIRDLTPELLNSLDIRASALGLSRVEYVRRTLAQSLSTSTSTESVTEQHLSKLPIQLLSPAIEERAWDVLKELSKSGKHRAPSIPDLLIAATAEKHGLSVLHFDKDFEIISKVTGQAHEKIRTLSK